MVASTLNFGAVGASTADSTAASTAAARPGRIRRAANAVWRAMSFVGQQRAAMYLHQMADTYADSNPAFAKRMRDAANGQHFD